MELCLLYFLEVHAELDPSLECCLGGILLQVVCRKSGNCNCSAYTLHYLVFYMKYLISCDNVGQIYLFVRVEKLGDGMEER